MTLTNEPVPATGSHWAIIDSGTSKHILMEDTYLANAIEDHTPVAGFSGQTSRATYKGDFNASIRTHNGTPLHLLDKDSALLVPDATRNLYSVKQSLENCHTIKFDSCAGLLPQGKPHLFVPFIRDRSTDLYLLPLIVPPSRHNGVYDVYNVNTQGSVQNSTAAQGSVQAHEQPIQLLKQADNVHSKTPTQQQYLIDHHRLSHVQQPRIRDLNIKDITKQPKRRLSKTNCPTCIAFKSSKTNRPPATTPQDRKVDGP